MRVTTLAVVALALFDEALAGHKHRPRENKVVAKRTFPKHNAKRQAISDFPPKTNATFENGTRYTIMDNDWSDTGFIPYLIALQGNMTVLGLTGNTANSWALQATLHALATLEHGNLSCIPVALGESYPIMMTEKRFNLWTELWGTLEWSGVFAPENLTLEAEGNDPTGGNADRISPNAFLEGYPNNTYIEQSAAAFMIEQVFAHPGQVSIYAAGSLNNVAAAIRLNSSFASTARELVIMGGYVDLNLFQTTSDLNQDLGSDINFIVDPEAAHIAITADWPSITIAGNVANTQYMSTDFVDQVTAKPNLYTDLIKEYYTAFPLWDETAAMIMAFPDVVANSTEVYMDVSTAYDSPFYGGTYLWGSDFAPSHVRVVNYVQTLDVPLFWEILTQTLESPKQCVNGVPQCV